MKIPTREQKIKMLKDNIITAFNDYKEVMPCCSGQLFDIDDISEFAYNLAVKSYEGKAALRDLLRHSSTWDEELDAVTINGNKTHEPSIDRALDYFSTIAYMLSSEQFDEVNSVSWITLLRVICNTPVDEDGKARIIEKLNKIDNRIYAEGKKPSRVLKALFSHYNLEGSEFERVYAQLADEVNAKKINFKYVVSVNPAHFLTMSNPHHDRRGAMLVSCHSLDSDYGYKNGCSGYAQDDVTLITFVPADPKDPETYNNRKTMRQLFFYKDGLLLQSRLYNADGGTRGDITETMRTYRELVQKEISECEGSVNLWDTKKYSYDEYPIETGEGFGGYPDWRYSCDFDIRISRKKGQTDFQKFTVGKRGLCMCCGGETYDGDNGLFCEDCGSYQCDRCGDSCNEVFTVHNSYGEEIKVCEYCRDNYYGICDCCEECFEDLTDIEDRYWCDGCRDEYFSRCDNCDEWIRNEDLTETDDGYFMCEECLHENYTQCDECGGWIKNDEVVVIYNGNYICEFCKDHYYFECEECGEVYPNGEKVEKDGRELCKDCADIEEEMA